jgi:hypothetical protein
VGSSLDSNLTAGGSDASAVGGPQSAGDASSGLPLPLPILGAAAGGGVLLLASLAALLFFRCVYARSLRQRRIAQRVSLLKVAAADRLLTTKAAGGEDSTAYQLDALAAVLAVGVSGRSREKAEGQRSGMEPSPVATRQQLTAGVVEQMLRLDGGSSGARDASAARDAPATLACRAARVDLAGKLTSALPRSALEAAVEASVHAASSEVERQRGALGGRGQGSPLRTAAAASHPLTSALVVNPLAAGLASDGSGEDARDSTASASAVQRAIIDAAVASLLGGEAAAEEREEGAASAPAAASPARRFVLPAQPGLFAALADAGAASTDFLRAYHANAAAADARLPSSCCVPLAALLPADGCCLAQPRHSKSRSADGNSDGKASFGVARSLCLARMQDRMAAARRLQPDPGSASSSVAAIAGAIHAAGFAPSAASDGGTALNDDSYDAESSVAVEFAAVESDDAGIDFAYAQPAGVTVAARRAAVRVTTTTPPATAAVRSSAAGARSSVRAVSLGTLAHKRSAGLGAMRASAGELKTAAALTEAQLARRTVEALVVLALDACAKRAGSLVVNAVTEDTPGCVATHLTSIVQLEAAKRQARVAMGPLATAVGELSASLLPSSGGKWAQRLNNTGHAADSCSTDSSGSSTALQRPSLEFAQSSPLHSPLRNAPVLSAGAQASLAERLLSAELAVLQTALQSTEALARTLAWETAWAALACRSRATEGRSAGRGVGGAARAAAARSSLAFVDSPLLQVIKQRAGVGARQGKPGSLPSGLHKQAADVKRILRLTPEQQRQGGSALNVPPRNRSSVVVRSAADSRRGGAAGSPVLGGHAPPPGIAALHFAPLDDSAAAVHPRSKVRPSLLQQSPASPATTLPQRHRVSRGSIGITGRAAYSPYRRGGVGSKQAGLPAGGTGARA